MGRIVGIDYGTARLGVAISDESKILARSLKNLSADKKSEVTATKLIEFLSEYEIEEIVIGLPLRMNGKKGSLGDDVQHFAEILKTKTPYKITLWDERLTTVQAERVLRESSLTRKERSKVVDGMAAVILLQSYLDGRCSPERQR